MAMKWHHLWLLGLVATLAAGGCSTEKNTDKAAGSQGKEAEIQANLAKLDSADRKLAVAQKYCAVENENRLGSMGKPIKLLVKDQPVFVCCKSCQTEALDDPDKTLAEVKKLKEKAAKEAAK
jgi:hypothetical protein